MRYNSIVKGNNPKTKNAVRLLEQADGRKEAERMKRIRGVWYYNGEAYTTLKAALVAAWPSK